MIAPYKTLIIDDEKLARLRLRSILEDYKSYFDIIDEAANGDQAYIMIEQLKPDLIFLDIQMPGKNVFKMLEELSHKPMVIFCTAYDNYALKAFESLSIDYLLKPIEKRRIESTILKLDSLQKNQNITDLISKIILQDKKNYPLGISHKIGDKIIFIKLADITYFKADNNYVNFYNTKSKEYITDQTLQSLEETLPPEFIRISKSVIINCNYVKELHKYFRGKFIVIIDDINQTKLETGGNYKNIIREKFNLS